MIIIILLLLEFKETVDLLTNLKRSIQWLKINQKNYEKQAREYSQLPPIRWLYPRCSKAEWRVTGQATTVARESLLGLSINQYTNKNPQRWQIALALMPPLEVHGAIEWQQSVGLSFYYSCR